MAKAKVYNQAGEEKGEVKLNPAVFEIEAKDELIKQVVQFYLSNNRQVLAHAKDRSEVRGGGKKPWKQKGTGRARHGSSRSPIWIGGGVTFGPTKERNFSKSLNKKMKKKALMMVLSDKAASGSIIVLEDLKLEVSKTKEMAILMKKLEVKSGIVSIQENDEDIYRAIRNLPKIDFLEAESLNVYDLLKREKLVITKKALKKKEEKIIKKAE